MAKQTITIKTRTRKSSSGSGYRQCNICRGTGRVKVSGKKKKKK